MYTEIDNGSKNISYISTMRYHPISHLVTKNVKNHKKAKEITISAFRQPHLCIILRYSVYLCQKSNFMKKDKILENLCSLLEKGYAKTHGTQQICSMMGLTERQLSDCTMESLGIDIRTLVECYSLDIPASAVIPDCA